MSTPVIDFEKCLSKLLSNCDNLPSSRSLTALDPSLPFVSVVGHKYDHFFGNSNSCYPFVMLSKKHGQYNCLCENTSRTGKLNLYFDFDSKSQKLSDDDVSAVIADLQSRLSSFFPGTYSKVFVKDASNPDITSFHFILHLFTQDGTSIYVSNKDQMKALFKALELSPPFDINVYSGYNIRLLYSNKYDQKNSLWTNRRFRPSFLSNYDNDIYSLATYCSNEKFLMLSDYVKKQFVLDFVKNHGFSKEYTLDQVQKRDQDDHWSLMLTEQKCTQREHQSNNSVAMLYSDNITIKCLDDECCSFLHQFIIDNGFSITLTDSNPSNNYSQQSSDQQTSLQKQINNTDIERIQAFALQTSQFLPQQTAYTLLKILSIQPNSATLLGQPPQNNQALQYILGTDNQKFQCQVGESNDDNTQDNSLSYSINGRQTVIQLWSEMVEILKKIEKKYSEKQLEKQNIIYNYGQYVETLNQTINNYNGEKEEGSAISNALKVYDEFSEIFQDYPEIHDHLKYYIFDNIDTFFDIIPLVQKDNFIYYKERLYFYSYDENCWLIDENCVRGKAQLKQLISGYLKKMKNTIREETSKGHMYLNRLLKEFGTRVNSYNYSQYAYTLQRPERQIFDQNNHLIHFKNTTYDVVHKKFIEKNRNHYNTFAISYEISTNFEDYQDQIRELHQILDNIFPDKVVKDWFLNSIGKNLHSVSKQKPIIFMKGIGRNGKSLMIQLIKTTLQQYVSKGKSTLFQKETFADSSKANSEVDNVISTKVCFIEEIADTQINLSTFKELTGGGEIQTRKMRENFSDKEILCQFYVACNNIPDFQNLDIAVANRLLAVEFETEFTEDPTLPHQKLIDYNLSEKFKELEYKQAFASIILNYSKLNIQIPQRVKIFTQEIQIEADPYIEFFQDKIIFTNNMLDYIKKEQLCEKYNDYSNKNVHHKKQTGKQLVNSFENFLRKNKKPLKYDNWVDGKKIRGFLYCTFYSNNILDTQE